MKLSAFVAITAAAIAGSLLNVAQANAGSTPIEIRQGLVGVSAYAACKKLRAGYSQNRADQIVSSTIKQKNWSSQEPWLKSTQAVEVIKKVSYAMNEDCSDYNQNSAHFNSAMKAIESIGDDIRQPQEKTATASSTQTPRVTSTPAPRVSSNTLTRRSNPSRTASSSSSRCPEGQQYAKVKMGSLFNRRTIFEGCGTANEIAYWRNQAHQDSQSRWNNFGRALQEAGDDYNRQVQQDIRDQQNRQRNCTTNFIGSTAYTNCY
ncbi:hypothetical protein N9997_02355 [Synechococcus sp. AH-603-L18]|nr:hypothetical protein [Synechococcus sp. AH-603-L18]MDB4338165.1 hypothetical protein [Synechococcus sp. AH-603-L18]